MRLLIGLFSLLLALQAQAQPLTMKEIGAGIYVHQGAHEDLAEGYHGDISNLSFIVGSKGVAVIDTGGSYQVGRQLREAIRQVTALPILYVINTHVHPDHIFGNAAFAEDQPQFVGHANLGQAMELRKDSYLRSNRAWLGEAFAGSEIVKPTLAIEDTRELDLGSRTLQLKAYPAAHTHTDLTVLDSKTSTLWTGDLLFVERTPSLDGDLKGWIAALDQLQAAPAKQAVPGHGPVVAAWQDAIANERRYLSVLLEDIRSSIRQGKFMEDAMDTAAASERDKWVLFDIVNRRNVNLAYPVLEWE